MREGLRMIERRETDDAVKLEALCAASRLGIAALDRGDFKELPTAAALADHLDTLAARVRSDAKGE